MVIATSPSPEGICKRELKQNAEHYRVVRLSWPCFLASDIKRPLIEPSQTQSQEAAIIGATPAPAPAVPMPAVDSESVRSVRILRGRLG